MLIDLLERIWQWINQPCDCTVRFGRVKHALKYLIFIIIVFFFPGLIEWFLLDAGCPAIDIENGTIIGFIVSWILWGLPWLIIYFLVYLHSLRSQLSKTKKHLNELLDMLLNDEKANNLFKIAKEQREILKGTSCCIEEGENRIRYFGLY